MMNAVIRRSAFVASKKVTAPAATSTTLVRAFSTKPEPVPAEDYYDGHLMADRLEYLNDMTEKCLKIEETMEDLKSTYAQKRKVYSNINWMQSSEIEQLFQTAAEQKTDITEQLRDLKALMQDAQNTFAVDAPDGEVDGHLGEEEQAVDYIIDHAAKHEDADKVRRQHKAERVIAKDHARDPEHDW